MKRHRKTHMEVEAAPTVSTDALENRVLIMERLIASMVTRIDNLENAMPWTLTKGRPEGRSPEI